MLCDPANWVTPIVVATLRRRADRREAITESLRRFSITDALFADDIGAAVDWQRWTDDERWALEQRVFHWRLPESNNAWWNRDLKLGEIACSLTHWQIWSYAQKQEISSVIILEDDAELLPEFEQRERILVDLCHTDPSWDLLYLGRERVEPDRGMSGAFALPGFSYCTHGYALSAKGLLKLLSTDLPEGIIPVDEFLPAMYMAHPRPDVAARFAAVIAAYGLVRDIVMQQDEAIWGSDTEASPFLST